MPGSLAIFQPWGIKARALLLLGLLTFILLFGYAFTMGDWDRYITPFPVPSSSSESDGERYKDVIYGTRNVFYGPWNANIPTTITAGESFSMEFTCAHPERKLCPTYYMVLFHGPTRLSVDPELFGPLVWTNNSIHEYATVTAQFSIRDPGQYRVFAYPELYYCTQWKNMDFPWQRAAVEGSPWDLTVLPPNRSNQIEEGFGMCSPEQFQDGRYLSIDSSLEFKEMYKYTGRLFIYAPYKCKIPARTVREAITSIRDIKHILYIGDSVTRNPFCRLSWKGLHGVVEGSLCDSKSEDYHRSHKVTSAELEIDGQLTHVVLSFLWTQDWNYFLEHNVDVIQRMDPPPSHVVLNFGLWIPNDVENLKQHFWNALDFMEAHFSHSIKHIILKTPASVVQAVDCRGKDWNPNSEPPDDSLDFRYGGAKQRHAIFEIGRRWAREHVDSAFRLSVIDAWLLTDPRPETTFDGRHYSGEGEDALEERPLMGEADASLQDLIFDEFITERSLRE